MLSDIYNGSLAGNANNTNTVVSNATSDATPDTLVLRNPNGDIMVNEFNANVIDVNSGQNLYLNFESRTDVEGYFNVEPDARIEYKNGYTPIYQEQAKLDTLAALGSGTTGIELFQSETQSEALAVMGISAGSVGSVNSTAGTLVQRSANGTGYFGTFDGTSNSTSIGEVILTSGAGGDIMVSHASASLLANNFKPASGRTASLRNSSDDALLTWGTQGTENKNVINIVSEINVSGVASAIKTTGDSAGITTEGASAHIGVTGYTAQIYTTGFEGHIYTVGDGATISTSGSGGFIETTGEFAEIRTSGDSASISTSGPTADIFTSHPDAYIRSQRFAPNTLQDNIATLANNQGQPCLRWQGDTPNRLVTVLADNFDVKSSIVTFGAELGGVSIDIGSTDPLATNSPVTISRGGLTAQVSSYVEITNSSSMYLDSTSTMTLEGDTTFAGAALITMDDGVRFAISGVAAASLSNAIGIPQFDTNAAPETAVLRSVLGGFNADITSFEAITVSSDGYLNIYGGGTLDVGSNATVKLGGLSNTLVEDGAQWTFGTESAAMMKTALGISDAAGEVNSIAGSLVQRDGSGNAYFGNFDGTVNSISIGVSGIRLREDFASIYTTGFQAAIGTAGHLASITTTGSDANISTHGIDAYISTLGINAHIKTEGSHGEIITLGSNARIRTEGYYAEITTSGEEASIKTLGNNANIEAHGFGACIKTLGDIGFITTEGVSAYINTGGESATISTGGQYAFIYTNGDGAEIFTYGSNAHLRTFAPTARIISDGLRPSTNPLASLETEFGARVIQWGTTGTTNSRTINFDVQAVNFINGASQFRSALGISTLGSSLVAATTPAQHDAALGVITKRTTLTQTATNNVFVTNSELTGINVVANQLYRMDFCFFYSAIPAQGTNIRLNFPGQFVSQGHVINMATSQTMGAGAGTFHDIVSTAAASTNVPHIGYGYFKPLANQAMSISLRTTQPIGTATLHPDSFITLTPV